jgi:hypothetical protein
MSKPVSLWKNKAKVVGPVAAAVAAFSRVPGLGDPFEDITLARSQAKYAQEDIVRAFIKSAQNSVTEQRMLKALMDFDPSTFRDPDVYGTELIGLATMLNASLEENRRKADTSPGGFGRQLKPEQVAEAREKASALEEFRKKLDLPPAVYSREEILALPPDVTEVLWYGVTPRQLRQREMR